MHWTAGLRLYCISDAAGPPPVMCIVSRTMTALRLMIPTAMYAVCAYAFLLPLSLLFAAVIWANKVSGVLYLCTDSVGIFDFIPPFVHSVAGDVYYVPAWRVYLAWYALLAGAFLLPALIIWFLWCLCGNEEHHDD